MTRLLISIRNRLRQSITHFKRSSAIQQGLLNLGIFLISLLLLSLTTYLVVKSALSDRLDNSLEQRMSMLMNELDDEDDWEEEWQELAQDNPSLYQTLDRTILSHDFFLVLPKSDLALKQNRLFRQLGFSTHELGRRQHKRDTQYRLFIQQRNDAIFIVGTNTQNDQEILKIMVSSFWLNALVALVLSSLLVIYLANRSQRQIRRIEQVLDGAAHGDLQQRIGPSKKHDDLAHVSGHIDTMLSRLETSMAAMTDISANIAHELKTPIARLRHDLNTALEQHENGEAIGAALNEAYNESSHITDTFNALLRIAQIEGGARRAHFTTLNLHSLLNTVLDIYQDVAEDAGMTLSCPPELSASLAAAGHSTNTSPTPLVSSTPRIQGDKELLVQMLANLIENAIRYCPAGTLITLDCQRVASHITLSVSDNGPGIPEADREKVFQRLYRLDKSRSDQRGTGLGLSLVKAIIELHGASIRLQDNRPGLAVMIEIPAD